MSSTAHLVVDPAVHEHAGFSEHQCGDHSRELRPPAATQERVRIPLGSKTRADGYSLELWAGTIRYHSRRNMRVAIRNPSVKCRSFPGRKGYDIFLAYMNKPPHICSTGRIPCQGDPVLIAYQNNLLPELRIVRRHPEALEHVEEAGGGGGEGRDRHP